MKRYNSIDRYDLTLTEEFRAEGEVFANDFFEYTGIGVLIIVCLTEHSSRIKFER